MFTNYINLFNSRIDNFSYSIQNYLGLSIQANASKAAANKSEFNPSFHLLSASKIISFFTQPAIETFCRASSLFSYGFKVATFANSLENKLAEKLDDIDRARILTDYYKQIQKTLSYNDQCLLENWLLKYCQFLSSTTAKEKRLLEELNTPAFQEAGFKKQMVEFLNGIDERLPKQQEAKRIAILYTGLGGGGHTAPANAIKEKLIAEKYIVEMIDADDVEKEFEPKIFGRGHEDIWAEIYQRKALPTLAHYLWKLHHLLYLPEYRKTIQVIRNKLANFNPDLIFAVADHKPQFTSLAYSLNRKMIFVHTDNKFSSKLKEIAQIQTIFDNALVKFTKPTTAEPISYVKTLPKIDGITKQIVDLQVPVRSGFKQISVSQQNEIKKEIGLDPSVKVCLVMMGNNGIESDVRLILNKIYNERDEIKERLHLIFVCGKNQALAKEISLFNKFNGTAITMEVKGFLNGSEMVQVAQASDVWITKMGGSTCSEALAMRKQVLSVSIPSHPWEDRNALANQACGLSEPLNKNEKILPQILKAYKKPPTTCYIPDWEEQFMQIILKESITTSMQPS